MSRSDTGAVELLERDANLAALASHAEQARSGAGQVVLIGGEAGVGKTALLEAFRDQVLDAVWAWGACDGLSTPRPLSPLHDIGRELGGDLRAACEQGAEREQLFDAFIAALTASDRLTVVVIEDVHWADEASLDLIRHAARRLGHARSLLLVTYRDDGLGADPMLQTALGDLASHRTTRRLALACLSEQAVRRLAGGSVFEHTDLHRLTGGNPYYLSEVLAGEGEQLPPSARDAVLARASRLGPDARIALDAAALCGARVDPVVVVALPSVSASGLDACVQAGMLVVTGGALTFRHDIARLAVATATPPQRRAQLHREILAALRDVGSPDDAQLAHHAEYARDFAAVLFHAPRAARAAACVYSHREAAAQYDRAIRHADDETPLVRAGLFEGFADETALIDRWEDSLQAREKALEMWRLVGDDLRAGDALQKMVSPLWRLCRGSECGRVIHEAVALLEPLPPSPELALAWLRLGESKLDGGDADEALRLTRQVAELAKSFNDHSLVVRSLITEGRVLASMDLDGLAVLNDALRIGLAAGLDDLVGAVYMNLNELHSDYRQFHAADEIYGEAIVFCDERDLATYGASMRGHRARSLSQRGRLTDGIELTSSMLGRQLPSPLNRINPLIADGVIRARLGDAEGAGSRLEEALALAMGTAEEPWVLRVHAPQA
jgi:tetratricopeptide (TPR) repeat protein